MSIIDERRAVVMTGPVTGRITYRRMISLTFIDRQPHRPGLIHLPDQGWESYDHGPS